MGQRRLKTKTASAPYADAVPKTKMSLPILPNAPKAAHTPGPWRANSRYSVKDSAGKTVADVSLNRGVAIEFANAKLIATAPNLLRVAENAINVLEVFRDFEMHKSPRDYEFIEQLEINLAFARETVAAAKGESQ